MPERERAAGIIGRACANKLRFLNRVDSRTERKHAAKNGSVVRQNLGRLLVYKAALMMLIEAVDRSTKPI